MNETFEEVVEKVIKKKKKMSEIFVNYIINKNNSNNTNKIIPHMI